MATIVIGETKIRSIIFIMVIVLATMEMANSVPLRRSHSRTIRLCSRSLSDALYMVCRNRGYNEPFSYSGEDEPRASTGPGLVEECCYHSCSFDQLEQYCKPDEKQENGNNQGVMEEALRIVNLPDSRDLSSSEDKLRTRSRIGHVGGMKKRSIRK